MLSNGACIAHFCKCLNGGLYQVVGVGRALGLSKDILDASSLENGTHCTTSYHTGTLRCREDEDLSTAEAGSLLVGNGTLDNGDLDEVLLCGFSTLGDGSGDFTGLTKTITDRTLTVTNDYDGSEGEGAATLGHFGYTIDSNESILVLFFFFFVYSVCHNL